MSEAHPIAGRLAALALLAGAIAAVAVFGVLPMVERIRAADEALDFDRQLILRLSAASVNPGSYDTRLAALRSRIDQSDLYLRAETEPLAAVALQEQVKSAVGQYGGELRSVQSLPSQDADGLTRIGLRVGMTGELEAVLRVLHQLESDEPLVFAENLQINEAGRRRRRSQEAEQENAQLSVRFDIFGYLPPAVDQ
jgi:general secretion pathway protein M